MILPASECLYGSNTNLTEQDDSGSQCEKQIETLLFNSSDIEDRVLSTDPISDKDGECNWLEILSEQLFIPAVFVVSGDIRPVLLCPVTSGRCSGSTSVFVLLFFVFMNAQDLLPAVTGYNHVSQSRLGFGTLQCPGRTTTSH